MAFLIGDVRAEDPSVKSKSKADAKAEHHDGKGSMFVFVCLNKNTIPDAKTLEAAFKKWFAQPDEADAKVEVDAKKESGDVHLGQEIRRNRPDAQANSRR